MGGQTSKPAASEPLPTITRKVPGVGINVVETPDGELMIILSDSDDDDAVLPFQYDSSDEDSEDPIVEEVEDAIDDYRRTQTVIPRLPLDGPAVGIAANWEIRADRLVGVVTRGQMYSSLIMMLYLGIDDVMLPLLGIELLDENGNVEYAEENDKNNSILDNVALRQFLQQSPGLGARVYLDLGDHFWVTFPGNPLAGLEDDHQRLGDQLWNIMERINTSLTPNQSGLFFHGNLRDAIFYNYGSGDVLINIFAANSEAPGVEVDIDTLTDVYVWLHMSRILAPEDEDVAPGQMEQIENENARRRSVAEHLTMARKADRMRNMLFVIDNGGIPDPDSYTFTVNVFQTDEYGSPEPPAPEKHKPPFTVDDLEQLTALGRKELVLQRCFQSWTRF